jgi:hypothetical protein
VRVDDTGHYEAGILLLGDDVVMDKTLGHAKPEPESVAPAAVPTFEPVTESDPDQRTWTSADGKFSVEAEFLSYGNDKVKLKKADGKVIDLPKDKLSDDDQEWLRKRGR